MDDTSSSEDEITKDALKEATDHQFLKDSYFLSKQSENSNDFKEKGKHNNLIKNENSSNPVSLRKSLEQQDTFYNFGVTPTFQSFVAKKLEGIIEKSIKIKEKQTDDIIREKGNDNNCGIKLFNSSSEFLIANEESESPQKRRKVETTLDEKTNLLKCKEVAIEPERILAKVETKSWTSKRKEPEFKYKKLRNGTLVEKTEPFKVHS